MRLDKFLKTMGIIKRRTISKEVCDNENVLVNNVPKKSSYEVKEGDIIKVMYYNNTINIKVIQIPPKQIKSDEINKYIEIN